MNNQEAFDKACALLKQQNACSVRGQRCAYAGPDGRACAIGGLLPRELAERLDKADSSGWQAIVQVVDEPDWNDADVVAAATEAKAVLGGCDDDFLDSLQRAHDFCQDINGQDFWKTARTELTRVASRFGLSLPPELQS